MNSGPIMFLSGSSQASFPGPPEVLMAITRAGAGLIILSRWVLAATALSRTLDEGLYPSIFLTTYLGAGKHMKRLCPKVGWIQPQRP